MKKSYDISLWDLYSLFLFLLLLLLFFKVFIFNLTVVSMYLSST